MNKGCCGQPARRQKRLASAQLPKNPALARGSTRLLFLGQGADRLRGPGSGLVYHVAEHRRAFAAHPADVQAFLRRRDVILAP